MKTVFAIYLTLAGFLMIPSLGVFFTGHRKDTKIIEAPLGKAARDSIKISKFLTDMTDARLMGIEEGRLAMERGTTLEIRKYGELMVNDQQKMLEQIKALADKRGITVPATISNERTRALAALKEKTGESFDLKFMRMMKTDHKRDIKMCKKIKKVNNEYVNMFVNENQPVMELHLQRLKQLRSDYYR